MDKFILDRIENELYVLETEDGKTIDVSKNQIKTAAKEGDVLIKKGDGYYFDKVKTKERQNEIEQLMEGMWNDWLKLMKHIKVDIYGIRI